MKNKRITWGLVTLVVLATIMITTGTIDNFSQQNIANNTHNPIQTRQKDYPVIDYDAPEPIDPREREEKRQKNRRYDTHGPVVVKYPNPKTLSILSFDAELLPPALPSAQSSFIIIGEVLNSKASLSNNRKGVYSEYIVRIETILKEDSQNKMKLGRNITVDRAGGYVKYPNGQKVLYLIEWQNLPETNKRYLFFLNNENRSPNYRIITGYELNNGSVSALDNSQLFYKFNGINEIDFIKLILNNMN